MIQFEFTEEQNMLREMVRKFTDKEVKPLAQQIDRQHKIPRELLTKAAELGLLGIPFPEKYGGSGFGEVGYCILLEELSHGCASTTVTIGAHTGLAAMSIYLGGTEDQKQRYVAPMARGEKLGAYALTEPGAGSDAANIQTTAVRDGNHWVLNGTKLWITNGGIADVFVVYAVTDRALKARGGITAFIVEKEFPGFSAHELGEKMGIRGSSTAELVFQDVRVPKENLLWGEGKGLKLALITLNTGRLTLPITAVAVGKRCLEITRRWAGERVQWGQPIGKHDAIAQKIGAMAANTFAMEAVAELCGAMADQGGYDIRLEAAIAKLYNSEACWRIIDDTVQIRGGRGYETADSLRARGEKPVPVERIMRDFRINLIFEGSSEIMHLFIAREAVDKHLQVAGAVVLPEKTVGEWLVGLGRAAAFYGWWYPSRWIGWGFWPKYEDFGPLARHVRYVERGARRLARGVFHAMMRFGTKLEFRQAVLFRLVDVGAELFAMAVTCARARWLLNKDPAAGRHAVELADLFCRQARGRIRTKFKGLWRNEDVETYRVAQQVLKGDHSWLEKGMVELEMT